MDTSNSDASSNNLPEATDIPQQPVSESVPPEIPETPVDQKTNINKILVAGILVLLVLVLAVGFFLIKAQQNGPDIKSMDKQVVDNQTTPTILPSPTSTTGNSTDDLDKESTSLDKLVDNLDTDLTNIDQGLNDQQLNLE